MTTATPRPRTTADVDRDLTRHCWLREQAIDRLAMHAAAANRARIDELLDERLTLQRAAR